MNLQDPAIDVLEIAKDILEVDKMMQQKLRKMYWKLMNWFTRSRQVNAPEIDGYLDEKDGFGDSVCT